MSPENTIPLTPTEVAKSARSVYDDIRWFLRAVWVAADRFYWDNGLSKASSLAYTSLLSLVPLLVLCFGLLSSFTASANFVAGVRSFLFKQFVPNNEVVTQVLDYIQKFSAVMASFNVVAIFLLVVTSLLLLNSIESTLNETWQVYTPRPYLQRVGIYSAIILIAPIMLVSSYYFAVIQVDPLLDNPTIGLGLGSAIRKVFLTFLPFSFDLSVFVLLFFLVPKAPVRFIPALLGGIVSALLFAAAKILFSWYLAKFPTYQAVYSTLAAIPISLLWLYFIWSIVLFGAEVSYQAQYLPRVGRIWRTTVMGVGDARLLLSIQALVLIGRAFRSGNRVPNDIEICEALGCSSVVLKPALDALEQARLIGRTDSRDMQIALLRDPSQISLNEIREALFGNVRKVNFPTELERLFASLKDENTAKTMNLDQIIKD